MITGVTAGIGEQLADQAVCAGAVVIGVARSQEKLDQLCRKYPSRFFGYAHDLGKANSIHGLADHILAQHADVSVVINNAGVQELCDFTDGITSEMENHLLAEIELNFSSLVMMCAAFLPRLKLQARATIINVSSGLALTPKKSAPVYCATKAAVRSFTQALRYQCADSAPHIAIIEALPPLVDTAMTAGRGKGKMSSAACARQILQGLDEGQHTIYVGKSKVLRLVQRLSPALAARLLRNG